MSAPLDDAALLVAELLARRWLPRQHPKVRRALIDADLWSTVQDRLAQVGLRLIDNVHADHVAVALLRPAESAVFGESGLNSHNNVDLPRDAVSLLVVLWSLIILPKRERQAARASGTESTGQNEMFKTHRPLPSAASVSGVVSYRSLLADFGVQLGKKTRMDGNLRRLSNHGFIVFRGDDITEGPLLDLLLDYDTLAPRILDGALSDVLLQARAIVPAGDPDAEPPAADDTADDEQPQDSQPD
ncbi:hypothetical protein [Rhizobacter sp. Root1221]|uniref:hypothetical protein n=1 Tax=Rhizobacter sp. Root1221 TaxID=1736433 RepID=UPI0007012035|nr:hypothetical protein [Rhizobacter sp. Root1221]KQW01306.1 hypothetical protein ASC87_15615 [Rhizobacter sp. Root1221]